MHISSVTSTTAQPSFKAVILGNGGAEKLARTMPVESAKEFIRNNKLKTSDILITSGNVEVISNDKKNIFDIKRIIAKGHDFLDIEAFEHGNRCVFKLKQEIKPSVINKYGDANQKLSLAEIITDLMEKTLNWEKLLHYDSARVSSELSNSAKELEMYNNSYYTF